MMNFFEKEKKITLKWLIGCEKKEKNIKSNVEDLKDSKNELIKVKV